MTTSQPVSSIRFENSARLLNKLWKLISITFKPKKALLFLISLEEGFGVEVKIGIGSFTVDEFGEFNESNEFEQLILEWEVVNKPELKFGRPQLQHSQETF